MTGKRGNPNGGKPSSVVVPHIVTEFEIVVRHLGLQRRDYAAAPHLQEWCLRNKNRRYVPEWLLDTWEMTVEVNYGSVASPH